MAGYVKELEPLKILLNLIFFFFFFFFLDKSLLTDSKLLKTIPVIDIFDKLMKSAWNKTENVDKSTHLTPYQRYKLVKPFADSEETVDTEANEIISSNKDKIEKVKFFIQREFSPQIKLKI